VKTIHLHHGDTEDTENYFSAEGAVGTQGTQSDFARARAQKIPGDRRETSATSALNAFFSVSSVSLW
jgi:hypothetical protein